MPLETCARTGVTAGTYGGILDVISGQTQSLTGGNPELSPEVADTTTLGVVWTPAFVEGLSLSLDYFDIVIEDAITSGIPAQTSLNECLATGDPIFCDLIRRSSSGSLAAGTFGVGFQQTNINIGEFATSGFDLQATYNFGLGRHSFTVDYAATILDTWERIDFPGADVVDCLGKFGNNCQGTSAGNAVTPEYRHRANLTWVSPWSVDVNLAWRYFGETENDNVNEEFETKLDAVNYVDLAATWYVFENFSVRGSILNVFEEDPPVFSGAGPALGNGNTYPTTFDTSRALIASLTLTF